MLETLPDLSIERAKDLPLFKLKNYQEQKNKKVLICAEGLGRRESLSDLLNQSEINHKSVDTWSHFLLEPNQFSLIVSPLHNGFVSDEFIVVTEAEIFPNFIKQSKRSTRDKILIVKLL